MKVFAYNYRHFDEAVWFDKYCREMGIELGWTTETPTLENAHLAAGYDYISIIVCPFGREMVLKFHELGVKMISTRTIGFDHIDLEAARECGIRVSSITYSPDNVADYTVMLMLMGIRQMKRLMERALINDFTLNGIQGKEMHNLTVGVIGTGRIGRTVLRDLTGFRCRLLAYDPYKNPETEAYAEYVDLDTLYAESDIVSLHIPMSDETFHMINKDSIAKMKDGVLFVNTARGALVNSADLIDAIESGKIGGACLDVIENEYGLYHFDRKNDVLNNREMSILRGFPNVIVTPHKAFYSDQAVDDMVRLSLESCMLDSRGKEYRGRIV